jgi:hypothetical protein
MGKIKELVGQRFGRLVVIAFSHKTENGKRTFWKCKCDCGNEVIVRRDTLTSGDALSCGCLHSEIVRGFIKNILGLKFGRLLVINTSPRRDSEGLAYWLCRCECGNEIEVCGSNLRSGHTKSCGCFSEGIKGKIRKLYGELGVIIHNRWKNMRDRCLSPVHKGYKHYGGRGITICKEWDDVEVFYIWAINNGFEQCLELDRIDVNGNYCPENCRWVTEKEQARNKRNSHMITYNGETKCMSEWAEILNMVRTTLSYRLDHFDTVEEAFFTPLKKRGRARGTKIL